MRNARPIELTAAAVIAGLALLAGCGTGTAPERQDATRAGQSVDRTPAEVLAFPDGFRNVAFKCDRHGHRVYSASTGNSGDYAQVTVIADPSCGR